MSKAFNMSMIMEDKWCGSAAATDPDCEEDEASPEDCSAAELDLSRALSPCHRIRCAADTLQLAVNGALRKDQASKELLDAVNRVVNLFRRSPLCLKEICSKDLVPATGSRWNSVLAALKRLIQLKQNFVSCKPVYTIFSSCVGTVCAEGIGSLNGYWLAVWTYLVAGVVALFAAICLTGPTNKPVEMDTNSETTKTTKLSGYFWIPTTITSLKTLVDLLDNIRAFDKSATSSGTSKKKDAILGLILSLLDDLRNDNEVQDIADALAFLCQ
ncbi:zinc finger BED domain-containing protein 4-like [Ixodes scapularis]